MRIEEEFDVPVAPDVTYRELNDVGGIGYCIAGVKDVEVVNADESRWKIEVRAGFMALTVKLDARITERADPEYLAFAAEGQDVTIAGHVRLTAAGERATHCQVVIDAEIGGPLGPLADLMARGPQEQLVAETVANLRERLVALAPPEPAVVTNGGTAAPAPAPPRAAPAPPGRPRPRLALGGAGPLLAGGLLVVVGYLLGRARR